MTPVHTTGCSLVCQPYFPLASGWCVLNPEDFGTSASGRSVCTPAALLSEAAGYLKFLG